MVRGGRGVRDDTIHVLLVEDDPADARFVQEMFRDRNPGDTLVHKGTLAGAITWLDGHRCDAVLLDLSLPDSMGIETIKRMARAAPTMPIVVLSGFDDPDFALLAVEVGAQDYLVKGHGNAEVLARVIRYAILRKQMEEYARLAGARVKSIIELAHDAIVAITPDQTIVLVNPAAERLFGWPAALLCGRSLNVLIPERFHGIHPLHIIGFAGGSEISRTVGQGEELFGLARDGREIPVEITVSRTPSPEGLLFTAFIRDVTERKKAEAALRAAKDAAEMALIELGRAQRRLVQAEKLSALGQMVAGVAHEVNTPIGNALTAASYLTDQTAELRAKLAAPGGFRRSDLSDFLEQVDEAAAIVVGSMQRASGLVQLFKETAAGTSGTDRCAFSLPRLLADFAGSNAPMLAERGIALVVDCPEGVVMDSHPVAMTQVLSNLLSNTLQHAFPDGRTGRFAVRVSADGDDITITVADDGVGIAPDDLPKVFEPFFTTRRHAGCTGLGLHIVYNLVYGTLGGHASADSAPGLGTTVTLDLPRQAPD